MVMPNDSTGMALEKLRRMVSLSSTFQTELGVGSAAAALPFIFTQDKFRGKARPLAVVFIESDFQATKVADGAANFLLPKGGVQLYLARDTPTQFWDDEIQGEIDAEDYMSNVHFDIMQLAGADDLGSADAFGHLNINGSTRELFTETDQKVWNSEGHFYYAVYKFEVGIG